MAGSTGTKGGKASPQPARKRKSLQIPRENIPYESDYYAANGAALIASKWTLQVAFTSPNLDAFDGVLNTADVVVTIPWPLAKALALALNQIVDKHHPESLPADVVKDIEVNGGMARSLTGFRRA